MASFDDGDGSWFLQDVTDQRVDAEHDTMEPVPRESTAQDNLDDAIQAARQPDAWRDVRTVDVYAFSAPTASVQSLFDVASKYNKLNVRVVLHAPTDDWYTKPLVSVVDGRTSAIHALERMFREHLFDVVLFVGEGISPIGYLSAYGHHGWEDDTNGHLSGILKHSVVDYIQGKTRTIPSTASIQSAMRILGGAVRRLDARASLLLDRVRRGERVMSKPAFTLADADSAEARQRVNYPVTVIDGTGIPLLRGNAVVALNQCASRVRASDGTAVHPWFSTDQDDTRAVLLHSSFREVAIGFVRYGLENLENSPWLAKTPIVVLCDDMDPATAFRHAYYATFAQKDVAIVDPHGGGIVWSANGMWPRVLVAPYSSSDTSDRSMRVLCTVINYIAASPRIIDPEADRTLVRILPPGVSGLAREYLGTKAPSESAPTFDTSTWRYSNEKGSDGASVSFDVDD